MRSAGMVTRVVLPFVLVSITVILLALSQSQTLVPRLPQTATVRAQTVHASSGEPNTRNLINALRSHAATRISSQGGPRSSREARGRGRDPLRDHRAIVGRDARTPWYVRVRSLILLILMVLGLGMAAGGFTLLVIASGRFLLETLAG